MHIKTGDTVFVLSGKDRGKKGKVIRAYPKKDRVIVEGVNMVTKHKKPKSVQEPGGLVHQEAPIHISNIMCVCDKCKTPSRISRKILENGQKVRVCNKCGEVIDVIKEGKAN